MKVSLERFGIGDRAALNPSDLAVTDPTVDRFDVCAVISVGRAVVLLVGAMPRKSQTFLRNDDRQRSLPVLISRYGPATPPHRWLGPSRPEGRRGTRNRHPARSGCLGPSADPHADAAGCSSGSTAVPAPRSDPPTRLRKVPPNAWAPGSTSPGTPDECALHRALEPSLVKGERPWLPGVPEEPQAVECPSRYKRSVLSGRRWFSKLEPTEQCTVMDVERHPGSLDAAPKGSS